MRGNRCKEGTEDLDRKRDVKREETKKMSTERGKSNERKQRKD